MAIKIGELIYELETIDKNASSALKKYGKVVDDSGKKVIKFEKTSKTGFQSVQKEALITKKRIAVLGAAITAAGTAFAGFAVKEASEFQSRMSDINTLLNLSQKELKGFGDQVLELSSRVPEKGSVLSESLYDVVSAGIEGTNKQMTVLEEATKLGVAGLGSTGAATDLLTSALNAFQIDASKANDVSDTLFKTVKGGKTTIDQLSRSFGTVAPIAAATGVKFDELQAATAALTTAGKKTSIAQTELKALFTEMTREGTKLSAALEKVGIKNAKASIESDGFVAVLKKLKDESGLTETQFKNLFGSVEGAGAALSLTGAQGAAFNKILADMRNGGNAVNEAFDQQSLTFDNLFQTVKNQLNQALLRLGNKIIPLLTKGLKDLQKFLEENKEQVDAFLESVGTVAVAVVTGLIEALKSIISIGGSVTQTFKDLGITFTDLGALLTAGAVFIGLSSLPALFTAATTAAVGLKTTLIAINPLYGALAAAVAFAAGSYFKFNAIVKETIANSEAFIQTNQKTIDSFNQLKEASTGVFAQATKERVKFQEVSKQIAEELKKRAELETELSNVLLDTNLEQIIAIDKRIKKLQQEQNEAAEVARGKVEALVDAEGEIFRNQKQFADLREKLGKEEFEKQVALLKDREGKNDEINRAILSGEVQLTKGKVKLAETFGSANIEILKAIAEADEKLTSERLKLAKEFGLKDEKLITSLLKFNANANKKEVANFVKSLTKKQDSTKKFNNNLKELLKPKIQKIGIVVEGLQEGGPFDFLNKSVKILNDPNTYKAIIEGFGGIGDLAAEFDSEIQGIDTDIDSLIAGVEANTSKAIGNISGVSGGAKDGMDEATKKLKDQLKELEKGADQAFKTAESAVGNFAKENAIAQEKIQKDIDNTNAKIQTLTDNFNAATAAATQRLEQDAAGIVLKAEEDRANLLSQIAKQEKDLGQEEIRRASELEKAQTKLNSLLQNQNKLKSGEVVDTSAQIAAQKLKVQNIQAESSALERLAELRSQLAEADAILATQDKEQLLTQEQLEEARRKAALNPLEALIERFDEEQRVREENFEKELAILEEQRDVLTTSLEERKAEFTAFTNDLISEDERFTTAANAAVQSREKTQVDSINRLIIKYNELARAKSKATSAAGGAVSTGGRGFAQGGFTGNGPANQVAGEVHKGEWVAPKWMVKAMTPLFSSLEGMRSSGRTGSTHNNQRTQNITVNNRGSEQSDLWRNKSYIGLMGKYLLN